METIPINFSVDFSYQISKLLSGFGNVGSVAGYKVAGAWGMFDQTQAQLFRHLYELTDIITPHVMTHT